MLILKPTAPNNAPVSMRCGAIASHFHKVEYIDPYQKPSAIMRKAREHGAAIVTMPPFRNFWLTLVPGVRTIVDWRDGWSIAMATGYGGTSRKKPIKAIIAKCIELATIALADEVWTCTPGLMRHHTKGLPDFLRRKVKFVPNGHQMDVLPERFDEPDFAKTELTAVCAGKFLQYGREKAEHAIITLARRYPNARIKLRVIGAEGEDGGELWDFVQSYGLNVSVIFESRRPYHEVNRVIADADLAVAIIRDENYDFGTKIFDYVAVGTPILDIFGGGSLRAYFAGCFDTDYAARTALEKAASFHRTAQIDRAMNEQDNEPRAGSREVASEV